MPLYENVRGVDEAYHLRSLLLEKLANGLQLACSRTYFSDRRAGESGRRTAVEAEGRARSGRESCDSRDDRAK